MRRLQRFSVRQIPYMHYLLANLSLPVFRSGQQPRDLEDLQCASNPLILEVACGLNIVTVHNRKGC